MKAKKPRSFNLPVFFLLAGMILMIHVAQTVYAAQESPSGQNALTVPPRIMIDPKAEGLKERVTLDLRNIEISEALKFLAMKGSLNLVIGKNVAGRVSLYLTDVSISDVLEIILLSNNSKESRKSSIKFL